MYITEQLNQKLEQQVYDSLTENVKKSLLLRQSQFVLVTSRLVDNEFGVQLLSLQQDSTDKELYTVQLAVKRPPSMAPSYIDQAGKQYSGFQVTDLVVGKELLDGYAQVQKICQVFDNKLCIVPYPNFPVISLDKVPEPKLNKV